MSARLSARLLSLATAVIALLGTSVVTQTWKSFSATSTATGHAVWIPGSGKKIWR